MSLYSTVGFKKLITAASRQLVKIMMLFKERLADYTETYENNHFN